MNAFLTGSRVYGVPRLDSDVDLVIKVSPETQKILEKLSTTKLGTIRFGNLNLIMVTTYEEYKAWERVTEGLISKFRCQGEPTSREEAKKLIIEELAKAGCKDKGGSGGDD